ncbi:hypothetical protein [Streptomyces niveus]|uniref:hypothetical protein n=1 Tax=Streptomyces niveus TaxID=193462 RepID=UPI00343237CA
MSIFSKHLADGRTAHVTPVVTPLGYLTYEAADGDGRRIASGWLQEAGEHGVPADKRPPGCTHLIAAYPKALWFTAEETSRLSVLGEEAQAAFDASEEGLALAACRRDQAEEMQVLADRTAALRSPEGEALVRERQRLANAAEAVLDTDVEQRTGAHDDEGGDPGAYYRIQQPQSETAYDRAVAALEAFDSQHPELVAALDEEKAANLRRFMDIN